MRVDRQYRVDSLLVLMFIGYCLLVIVYWLLRFIGVIVYWLLVIEVYCLLVIGVNVYWLLRVYSLKAVCYSILYLMSVTMPALVWKDLGSSMEE